MNYKQLLLGAVTCAVVLNVENVIAAEMEESSIQETNELDQKTKQTLLVDFMWRQDIHAYLSTRWKLADIKEKTWWKRGKYEDSIFNVISGVICDYVLKTGTFNNVQNVDFTNDDQRYNVYLFGDATPDLVSYNQANWNALVLYNLIFSIFSSTRVPTNEQGDLVLDWLKKIGVALNNYCIAQDIGDNTELINKAISDINRYVQDLDLLNYLKEVIAIYRDKNQTEKAPYSKFSSEPGIIDTQYVRCWPGNGIDVVQSDQHISLGVEFLPSLGSRLDAKVKIMIPSEQDINDVYDTFLFSHIPSGIFKENNIKEDTIVNFEKSWGTVFINELPQLYCLDFFYQPDNIGNIVEHSMDRFWNYWLMRNNKIAVEHQSETGGFTQSNMAKPVANQTAFTNQVWTGPVIKTTTTVSSNNAFAQKEHDVRKIEKPKTVIAMHQSKIEEQKKLEEQQRIEEQKRIEEQRKIQELQKKKFEEEQQKKREIRKQQVLDFVKTNGVLDAIKYIYNYDDDIIKQYDMCEKNGKLNLLPNVCKCVYQLGQKHEFANKDKLSDIVKTTIDRNWSEKATELYMLNYDFTNRLIKSGLYTQDDDIIAKLCTFSRFAPEKANVEQQKWIKASEQCIDLFNENFVSDKIGTHGSTVIDLILKKNNKQAESFVRKLMLKKHYGDNWTNELNQYEGNSQEEKINKCFETLHNLYVELDEEYGISGFKDEDVTMNKIFEFKGNRDPIVKWIEATLNNN